MAGCRPVRNVGSGPAVNRLRGRRRRFRRRQRTLPTPQVKLPDLVAQVQRFADRVLVPHDHDHFSVADEHGIVTAMGQRYAPEVLGTAHQVGRDTPRQEQFARSAVAIHQPQRIIERIARKDHRDAPGLGGQHPQHEIPSCADPPRTAVWAAGAA